MQWIGNQSTFVRNGKKDKEKNEKGYHFHPAFFHFPVYNLCCKDVLQGTKLYTTTPQHDTKLNYNEVKSQSRIGT